MNSTADTADRTPMVSSTTHPSWPDIVRCRAPLLPKRSLIIALYLRMPRRTGQKSHLGAQQIGEVRLLELALALVGLTETCLARQHPLNSNRLCDLHCGNCAGILVHFGILLMCKCLTDETCCPKIRWVRKRGLEPRVAPTTAEWTPPEIFAILMRTSK